ncbi:MAG: DUF4242 domain-containing protein [Acidimicrobiia bacterium]
MAVFMVERDLPGMTIRELIATQQAAIKAGRELSENGKNVRYLRSTYVPGSSRCMCLFEAGSLDLVQQVNEKAKLPFTRIVEVLTL